MKACSIIIVSYGSDWWKQIGDERALPSARAQGDYEIIRIHRDDPETNLSALRNEAATIATGERLIFLDADDILEPGYVDAMLASDGDIRCPMVRVLQDPEESNIPEPFELEPRPLLDGNYTAIGFCIPRSLFLAVGGFPEWLEYCEDWGLMLAAWCAGAAMKLCRSAVYRQIWRPNSRNQIECSRGDAIRQQIRDHYTPIAKSKGLL